jgi:hypothetical protein
MKSALQQQVVVGKVAYMLQLPQYHGGAAAFLEDPLLDGRAPISIGRIQAGESCTIIYRWLIDASWVTLTTEYYVVMARHPHRRRFSVVSELGDEGAFPVVDTAAKVTVQAHKSEVARVVWHQQRGELGRSVVRLQELQAQVQGWLRAVEGHV